jgi:Flp pilus assembly protein TadG
MRRSNILTGLKNKIANYGFFQAPKIVRRFKKDDEGVTAIEFALLAGPFFLLLMGIVESSLLFFAGQVLESSVDDVARKIRTGQLDQSLTQQMLRDEICDASALLFSCDSLNIDMQVVAKFADLGDRPEPTGGAIDANDFQFSAAGPKQIVMVTVLTEWPVYTNYLQQYLSNLNSGNALLSAVAVFKTEPYS